MAHDALPRDQLVANLSVERKNLTCLMRTRHPRKIRKMTNIEILLITRGLDQSLVILSRDMGFHLSKSRYDQRLEVALEKEAVVVAPTE